MLFRTHEDGLVVYVAATSETHCLPPMMAALLDGPCEVEAVDGLDALEQDGARQFRLPAAVFNDLLQLRILVPS